LGIVEIRLHRVGLGRMLVKDPEIQVVRPPVLEGGAATCGLMERAFRFVRHLRLPLGRLSRFPVYARYSISRARWLMPTPHQVWSVSRRHGLAKRWRAL